ncbi:hypothetical protein SUDANB121_02928 [Nocardiopsis dassonvillei]|uniref:hypothetical protein n=1 Tax=Nocardiopsis dassonvillei TaxID=2014 RepID=UPI003F57F3A2
MDMTIFIIIGVVTVLIIAAVLALALASSRVPLGNRLLLKKRFGEEYDRAVEVHGGRKAAERDLAQRLERHRKLRLRRLDDGEKARYRDAWIGVQQEFVDDPERALRDSRRVLTDAMTALGYPEEPSGTDDASFDRRLDDLSVAHGDEVAAVHRAGRPDAGISVTEHLREALVAHRRLLDSLLGGVGGWPTTHRKEDRGHDREVSR